MSKWNTFDEYGRTAQLAPGLVAFLPLTMSLLAWAETGSPIPKLIGAILTTSGGTYALAMIARNKGRALQQALWEEWGGSPTVQMLRHAGNGNSILREQWHRQLEKLLGRQFPTAEEERANISAADEIYEAAIRRLINERRDKAKYPLIFRENVNYGFCRNLYALRGIGLITATAGIVASGICGFYASAKLQALSWGCCVVSTVVLLVWAFIIDRSWPKQPAEAYARALLESCEPASARRKTRKSKSNPTSDAPNVS